MLFLRACFARVSRIDPARCLIAFTLCCATVLYLLGSVQRFVEHPVNLIENADFTAGLESWTIAGDPQMISADDGIRLSPVGAAHYGKISQTFDMQHRLYRLTAELRISGESRSEQTRYSGIGFTYRGEGVSYEHKPIIRFIEAHDWLEVDAIVEVPDTFDTLEFGVTSLGDGFNVQLRDIRLRSVEVLTSFRVVSAGLLGLVLALAAFVWLVLLIRCWNRMGALRFLLTVPPAAMLVSMVMYFALATGLQLGYVLYDAALIPASVIEFARPWAARVLQQPLVGADAVVAKLMHFGFFMGFGVLACVALLYRSVLVLLCGIALAVFTETMQTFPVMRSGSFRDIGLNLAGLATGVLLMWLCYWLYRWVTMRRSPTEVADAQG